MEWIIVVGILLYGYVNLVYISHVARIATALDNLAVTLKEEQARERNRDIREGTSC